MSPLDPDEFMDADTLAAWLGVERWTVVRMARLGKLPGRKVGKEWRFSRSAILQSFRHPGFPEEVDDNENPRADAPGPSSTSEPPDDAESSGE